MEPIARAAFSASARPEDEGGPGVTLSNGDIHRYRTAVIRMKLIGANPSRKLAGIETMVGRSNYFLSCQQNAPIQG